MLSNHQQEMISRSSAPTSKTKQSAIKEFESSYPPEQQWRLLVDGYLYAKTPPALLIPDQTGWRNYENREPNSLEAFFSAWQFCLRQLKSTPHRKDLAIDFILKLHLLATWDVKNVPGKNGEFRAGFKDATFSLGNEMHRITESGAQDLAMSLKENYARVLCLIEDNSFSLRKLTKFCFLRVLQKNEGNKKIIAIRENNMSLDEAVAYLSNADKLSNDYFLVSFEPNIGYQVKRLAEYADTTNLVPIIYSKIKHQNILYIGATTSSNPKLYALVRDVLTHYNNKITSLTHDQEKLNLIGKIIERLERIHPFSDGNGRVFVNLLLNYLLLEEGFSPATLFEPNVFDAFGYHVEVLTKGILNTQAIYAGERNLFGFTMPLDDIKSMRKIIGQALVRGLLHYLSEINTLTKFYLDALNAFQGLTIPFSYRDQLIAYLQRKLIAILNIDELFEMLNSTYLNACTRYPNNAYLIEIQNLLANIKITLAQESAAFIGQSKVIMEETIDHFSMKLKMDNDENILFSNMPVKDWDQFAANQYTLFGQQKQASSSASPVLKKQGK